MSQPMATSGREKDMYRIQNEQTNVPNAYRPAFSFPSKVITKLNRSGKHENKEPEANIHKGSPE